MAEAPLAVGSLPTSPCPSTTPASSPPPPVPPLLSRTFPANASRLRGSLPTTSELTASLSPRNSARTLPLLWNLYEPSGDPATWSRYSHFALRAPRRPARRALFEPPRVTAVPAHIATPNGPPGLPFVRRARVAGAMAPRGAEALRIVGHCGLASAPDGSGQPGKARGKVVTREAHLSDTVSTRAEFTCVGGEG